ncbi:MAG TPA: hypothetical protein VGQ92_04485 [Actinoplanes sp.]|nr:hypothetical protein [Actinoplanes sp.]
MSVALIELDLDAPPPAVAGRPPARYCRYVGLLSAALLVLAVGGAATDQSTIWRRVGAVALTGPDTSYRILDGRLYTMDTGGDERVISAWAMSPLRRLWSATTPLERDPSSGSVVHDGGASLVAAGAYVLLHSALGTSVLDARSGAVRWSTTSPVLAHSNGIGIVQETVFRPGTAYDESSGDPGPLYWSATGVPHTEPPQRTILRGLELATGYPRWSAEARGSVYVVPDGRDATGFVVIAADRLTLRAADTGAVIRQRALPRSPGADVSFPEIAGDLLLLRHDNPDGGGVATAYGMDTFESRWRLAEPADDGNAGTCSGLPCRRERGGMVVLDAHRGVALWHAGRYVNLVQRGPDTLEVQSASNRPLRLRDHTTGRVLVDLRGWETVADSDDQAPLVLFRAVPPDGHAAFGVLAPGSRDIQPLGLAGGRVRECASDERYVACRVADGIEVWSYRT